MLVRCYRAHYMLIYRLSLCFAFFFISIILSLTIRSMHGVNRKGWVCSQFQVTEYNIIAVRVFGH